MSFDINKFMQDNAILERIESAKLDSSGQWEMPWIRIAGAPRNFITGNVYKGGNVIYSSLVCMTRGFEYPLFAGLQQIKKAGYRVKYSEMKRPVYLVAYKPIVKERDNPVTGETETFTIPFLKYVTVWNIDQLEEAADVKAELIPNLPDIERKLTLDDWFKAAQLNSKLAGYEETGDSAHYVPSTDKVFMPPINQFRDAEYFYATLGHEMTHSTGHKSRLDRKIKNSFASSDYAFEELVAELGSMCLCAHLGITAEPREDHFKYLASWIKGIKNEPKMFLEAARLAGKAVDYLIEKAEGKPEQAEKAA
jgi:antirestriction protein ArdC